MYKYFLLSQFSFKLINQAWWYSRNNTHVILKVLTERPKFHNSTQIMNLFKQTYILQICDEQEIYHTNK